MKCPKCKYISFDFNQICPKCNKNIADERDRLNLPSYRPAPPALLGSLIGEADDSNVGLAIGTPEASTLVENVEDLNLDDSAVIEEGQDFDNMDFDLQFDSDIEGEAPSEDSLELTDENTEELKLEELIEDSGPGSTAEASAEEDFVIEPDTEGPAEDRKGASTDSLDLGDLSQELSDIGFDEEAGKPSGGEGGLEDLENLEDLAEPEDKESDKSAKSDEEELDLNLEDLELELDLDSPPKKNS